MESRKGVFFMENEEKLIRWERWGVMPFML